MFDKQNPLSAAEAGERLHELCDLVTGDPGRAVYIAAEEGPGSAVLVDKAHYQLLLVRARLAERLESSKADRAAPPETNPPLSS